MREEDGDQALSTVALLRCVNGLQQDRECKYYRRAAMFLALGAALAAKAVLSLRSCAGGECNLSCAFMSERGSGAALFLT